MSAEPQLNPQINSGENTRRTQSSNVRGLNGKPKAPPRVTNQPSIAGFSTCKSLKIRLEKRNRINNLVGYVSRGLLIFSPILCLCQEDISTAVPYIAKVLKCAGAKNTHLLHVLSHSLSVLPCMVKPGHAVGLPSTTKAHRSKELYVPIE